MVKAASAVLLASAGLVLAGAGDFYEGTTRSNFSPVQSGSFGGGNSNFFVGGSAEYLIDFEQALYTVHVGYEFGYSSIFVEGGFTSSDIGGIEIDVVPVTVNYKFEAPISNNWSFYVGGGVGVAFVDVDVDGFGGSLDDQVVALQAFSGLVYNVSEALEFYGGVRYLWTDDVDFGGGATADGFSDVSFGGGFRINF